MTSRTRDLATILGLTEADNTSSQSLGAGGAGGGGGTADTAGSIFDKIVREHSHTFDSDYTLDSARNGLVAGPVFIDSGVTITLNDSATLVIA